MEATFNFVPGFETKTVDGHYAKVITKTNDGKLLVFVKSFIGHHEDKLVKYALTGHRWSKNFPCDLDLKEAV